MKTFCIVVATALGAACSASLSGQGSTVTLAPKAGSQCGYIAHVEGVGSSQEEATIVARNKAAEVFANTLVVEEHSVHDGVYLVMAQALSCPANGK